MDVKIEKKRITGEIFAPPSKSYAHRMMICAALSEGESVIYGISESEDVSASLDCIKELGAKCEYSNGVLKVIGVGKKAVGQVFKCRESGSTLRFFIPIALTNGGEVRFEGAKRLIERGIGVYEEIFAKKGISVKKESTAITISGKLTPGEYALPGNVSSQFVSGLMFALPLLDGDSVIRILPPVESRGYIDITLDVLKKFGVDITEADENVFKIKGNSRYLPCECTVEGDWSNAAALLALNDAGCDIEVKGLNESSIQGDRVCVDIFKMLSSENAEIDLSDCPDLAPVMFAVAAIKNGAVFTGTRRLRIKESDRASVMAMELEKFGIKTEVEENRVIIHKGSLRHPSIPCDSHNDHRIVMAMAILGIKVGCEINGAEAINKSYPEFLSYFL